MNYYDKKKRNTDYKNIYANFCAGARGDTILCYCRNLRAQKQEREQPARGREVDVAPCSADPIHSFEAPHL